MLAAACCDAARSDTHRYSIASVHGHPDSDACADANTFAHAIARSRGSACRDAILDVLADTIARANLDSSANSYPCALANSCLRDATLVCGVRSSGDANHWAIPNAVSNALTGFQTDGNPVTYLWPRLAGGEHAHELDMTKSAVD